MPKIGSAPMCARAVTAVHDGYALAKSVARGPLGGALLSRCMLASLGARGTPLRPPYAFRRVQGPPPASQWEVRACLLGTHLVAHLLVEGFALSSKFLLCNGREMPAVQCSYDVAGGIVCLHSLQGLGSRSAVHTSWILLPELVCGDSCKSGGGARAAHL